MRQQYWKRAPVMLLVLLQCGQWPLLLQTKLLSAEKYSGETVNLAVFIEGQVSVKRKGWTNYAPVVFGTSLRIGDLLHLDESSRAKVVCSDLTLRDISPGIVGVPCEGTKPVLRRPDGSMINATRSGPSDGSFPVVLSPRMTKLLSPCPVHRWARHQFLLVASLFGNRDHLSGWSTGARGWRGLQIDRRNERSEQPEFLRRAWPRTRILGVGLEGKKNSPGGGEADRESGVTGRTDSIPHCPSLRYSRSECGSDSTIGRHFKHFQSGRSCTAAGRPIHEHWPSPAGGDQLSEFARSL